MFTCIEIIGHKINGLHQKTPSKKVTTKVKASKRQRTYSTRSKEESNEQILQQFNGWASQRSFKVGSGVA